MNIDMLFKEVGKYPLLTGEQEVSLAQAIEAGDTEARELMIKSNLRLAISIAKQYNKSGCPFEELIQESTIGLMEAVDRFDWRKGFKFSTYACWWIKQAVRKHVNSAHVIKMPSYTKTVLWQASQLKREYVKEFGHDPELSVIAEALGITEDTLFSLQQTASPAVSLDKPIGKDGDSSRTLADVIEDESETIDDKLMKVDMRELIRIAISELTPREQKIIRLRFGIAADPKDSTNFPITEQEMNKLEERTHANA